MFKSASKDTGLIKYELIHLKHGDDGVLTILDDTIRATVLLEMTDDMTVKIEPFVDKTKDEVDGFTDNVKVYVR